MHEIGVRGIRFNIVDVKPEEKGRLPVSVVRKMAERVQPFGWHIQFLMHVDEFPDFDDVKVGAGVGVRYLTPFGPLRIDAAVPLNPGPDDPDYGIYAGIGQAF